MANPNPLTRIKDLATTEANPNADDYLVIDGTTENQRKILTTDIVPDASESVAGKAELANISETDVGTDSGRVVTPAGLAGSIYKLSPQTIISSATPTPAIVGFNHHFTITALAVGATVGAPTGSPEDGWKLIIRIKDDGTSRTIAWNAIFRELGITLPTSTTISKTLYVGCIYNSTDTKWDAVATVEE